MGSSTSAGNLMVCAVVYNSTTSSVSSVTDSAGNSYVKAVGPVTSSSGVLADWRLEIWYKENMNGGSSFSATATFNATYNAYKRISCHEYSGIALSGALDQAAGQSGSSSTGNIGPVLEATQPVSLPLVVSGKWRL